MVIDVSKFRNDTDAIISDWAETCIIAQLVISYDDGGFSTEVYIIVTQSGVDTIDLDFQPLNSSDRYMIKEMGMNAVDMFAVYSATTITIKDDYYIFRYTESGDLGTNGVGSLNTLTDSSKTWITNEWEGFQLIDNDGIFFEITSNIATAVTISGTPSSGQYYVAESYIVRNIERNEDHFRILVEHQSKEH